MKKEDFDYNDTLYRRKLMMLCAELELLRELETIQIHEVQRELNRTMLMVEEVLAETKDRIAYDQARSRVIAYSAMLAKNPSSLNIRAQWRNEMKDLGLLDEY